MSRRPFVNWPYSPPGKRWTTFRLALLRLTVCNLWMSLKIAHVKVLAAELWCRLLRSSHHSRTWFQNNVKLRELVVLGHTLFAAYVISRLMKRRSLNGSAGLHEIVAQKSQNESRIVMKIHTKRLKPAPQNCYGREPCRSRPHGFFQQMTRA